VVLGTFNAGMKLGLAVLSKDVHVLKHLCIANAIAGVDMIVSMYFTISFMAYNYIY
jgi:hypothetical protein